MRYRLRHAALTQKWLRHNADKHQAASPSHTDISEPDIVTVSNGTGSSAMIGCRSSRSTANSNPNVMERRTSLSIHKRPGRRSTRRSAREVSDRLDRFEDDAADIGENQKCRIERSRDETVSHSYKFPTQKEIQSRRVNHFGIESETWCDEPPAHSYSASALFCALTNRFAQESKVRIVRAPRLEADSRASRRPGA